MPIKFLVLGGGGILGFLEGGGSANFIFMGVGIFPSVFPDSGEDEGMVVSERCKRSRGG